MNRNILVALGAAVIAAVEVGYWMSQGSTPDTPPALEQQADTSAADTATSEVLEMVLGDENAPVTVVEYASYTCPHCRNFHEQVFGELKANYIDTGKIKFVYREVYFDKFGLWAGMIARCAGPDRYFGVTDLLYEKQAEWLASRNDAQIAADLRKIGLSAGMTGEQLDACLADGAKAQAMVEVFQANAEADSVRSTPTFIIDGESYTNMNYADFSAILDERLGN